MAGILTSIFNLFGKKSDRDIEEIMPIVEKIHEAYKEIQGLSNDELRSRTPVLKEKIIEFISEEVAEIAKIRSNIQASPDMENEEKEGLYLRIDEIEKEINEKTDEILLEILPEAFFHN